MDNKMQAVKYRAAAAVAFGTGLTALFLVLLKLLMPTIASMPLSMFLIPGGILVALFSGPGDSKLALSVPLANALVYSIVFYVAISIFWRTTSAVTMRRATVRLAVPATILIFLICIPALNPLWPQGMTELAKQESDLQGALPLGLELGKGQAVLLSKGIQFHETTESSSGVVLDREGKSLTAGAGDRVLSARFQTKAGQFPCGYDMEIVLLFGQDNKLKERYVHRLRVCP